MAEEGGSKEKSPPIRAMPVIPLARALATGLPPVGQAR